MVRKYFLKIDSGNSPFRKTVLHTKIINKTRKTKNQGNSPQPYLMKILLFYPSCSIMSKDTSPRVNSDLTFASNLRKNAIVQYQPFFT